VLLNISRPVVPALVLPLLALLPARAHAQAEVPEPERYGMRLEYREYRPNLTGTVQKGANGEEGSIVDLIDDLGIEDDRTFDARVTFKIKTAHKLRAGYMPIDYHGDQEAPRNFTFMDTTYFRGDRVVTSVKGTIWSGDYQWEFYQGEKGYLGALLGARYFDGDTVLVDVDAGQRETNAESFPLPVLGVAGRAYAGKLSLEGEFAGLPAGGMGNYYEFEGSARFHISDRFAVMGGYRLVNLDARDDPDQVQFKLSGWQFGLELSL